LVPGLLGSPTAFRRRFAEPIERGQDAERRDALRELVSPFLLRRTKKQVLSELPSRTEVTRSVELTADEMARYEAERRAALAAVAQQPTDGKGRFTILAALTRLRRLACHPALVDPDAPSRSSKLSAALSMIESLREEGRRALVFSQFTGHLHIVRRALVARGIDPLYLDGGTPAKERASLVERFQEGNDPVFLISLKAGGTGLNLTAADTVIHLDPWWNPAAEDQASDRAHRIGQTRPVTVVRLIAQGTIEDKVLALHREKRELAESLLSGAETHARLDTDALIGLLERGPD
ncbi:MAG: DEAD/DEAH box helicase, partial [Sandaracinaceae bacterium]